MAAPTEPEAIPADLADAAYDIVRDIPSQVRTENRPFIANVIARAIAKAVSADRASRAPVDGAAAKPVAWRYRGGSGPLAGNWYVSATKPFGDAEAKRDGWEQQPLYTHPAPASPDAEMVEAARRILPYLEWTIGDESPGYHPTMPSAVAEFKTVLSKHEGDRS